jgi:hypothetical protein
METSFFRKLLRLWRKYIHCSCRYYSVHDTYCYKCRKKTRLKDEEYYAKKWIKNRKKEKWNSY